MIVRGEQGLGDTIQFSRYLPLVQRRGGRVVLDVPPPLTRLLSPLADSGSVPATETRVWEVSIGRLPALFGPPPQSGSGSVPYLRLPVPDPLHSDYHHPAGSKSTRQPRIGVASSARATHATAHRRSAAPGLLETICRHVGAVPVLVQRRSDLVVPPDPDCLVPDIVDLHDVAALVQALDVILTVDTAVLHVAGALGRPVVALLPAELDDMWTTASDASPWYPTVQVVRQARPGDWASVVAPAVTALRALLASAVGSRGSDA